MSRRVVLNLAQGGGPTSAALIEDDDPPIVGVEKPTVNRGGSGAGAAVKKEHRHAARVSRLFPIHHMTVIQPQAPRLVGLDRRIEVAAVRHREAVSEILYRPRR